MCELSAEWPSLGMSQLIRVRVGRASRDVARLVVCGSCAPWEYQRSRPLPLSSLSLHPRRTQPGIKMGQKKRRQKKKPWHLALLAIGILCFSSRSLSHSLSPSLSLQLSPLSFPLSLSFPCLSVR